MRKSHLASTQTELERELEVLESRLDDGERRIEDALAIGAETEAWEAFWIELLHSYETVYRQLEHLGASKDQLAA